MITIKNYHLLGWKGHCYKHVNSLKIIDKYNATLNIIFLFHKAPYNKVDEMAQWVKGLADLSLIPRTTCWRERTIPLSCPLTSIWML